VIKLANIYDKIEEKGKLEAKEIIKAGQQKAAALKKSIDEGFEKEYKRIIDDATRSNADYLKTRLTQVDQSAKQKSLYAKKAVINTVIERVHAKMLKLSDKELTDLVVKVIASDVIQGDEVVKVSKEDYKKYRKLFASKQEGEPVELDLLNKKLGKGYKLTLSKEAADIDGGFVLIGKRYDVNHSYKVLLDNIREEHESEVAKLLFGDGE
jgi:V/A-type H+-transporting ATPase subunit E